MRAPVVAAERQRPLLPPRETALASREEDNNRHVDGDRVADSQPRVESSGSDSEESDSDGEVSLRAVAAAAARSPATITGASNRPAVPRLDRQFRRVQPGFQKINARRGVLSSAKESQQQQQREPTGNNALDVSAARHVHTRMSASPERARNPTPQRTGDFAVEIESEAAEIRTLIARTAQLWSAVDQAERCEDLPPAHYQSESRARLSAVPTAITATRATVCTTAPAQYSLVEDEEGSTLSSDEYEYEGEDEDEDSEEDTETESVGSDALRRIHREASYATTDNFSIPTLRRVDMQADSFFVAQEPEAGNEEEDNEEGQVSDTDNDSDDQDTDAVEPSERAETRGSVVQLEQGEVMDASNRDINASKARAIKDAMLGNLLLLGFRENLTRAALEAGILEIDHYDSDCELAYVDIFMILVKMVCDAHLDALNDSEGLEDIWSMPTADGVSGGWAGSNTSEGMSRGLAQRSFLPFKWPVFDMAQFEFGNARPGTCFNSVCVLTNLPKVSMDRTEELMEVLSCNLFCMIGDPIQVVIPSVSSTGRTKGHAFLEFDDPEMAKRCALAVDGLTWGRGPFGRIRGSLFRQYQVKTPMEEQQGDLDAADNGGSFRRAYSSSQLDQNYTTRAGVFDFRGNGHAGGLEPNEESHVAQQRSLLHDNGGEQSSGEDEDEDDAESWVVGRPLEYAPLTTSPLLDLSAGSVETREASEFDQSAEMDRSSWDEEIRHEDYAIRFCRGVREDENDDSFGSTSALELQAQDEEDKATEQSLFEELSSRSMNLHSSVPRLRSSSSMINPFPSRRETAELLSDDVVSAGATSREVPSDCAASEQPWDSNGDDEAGVEKPWRSYCEDLIGRNREMQEQVAFARRRIVQLSHNNQKLHLLIDRVERDRDGLLFENDLLQTQLHGYEDHEHHHDSMVRELVELRKRLKTREKQENQSDVRRLDPRQHSAFGEVTGPFSNAESLVDIRSELNLQLSPATLESYKMKELKEWEQVLESALGRVRAVKEEKALEMQKRLDRQVEEQNELKLCVICLSNEKTILCLPCRHLCLCEACSRRQEVVKCPICRLEIDEMLAVYS